MEQNFKSLLEMANGAIKERVDYEMAKVIDNILDVNTKATAKRKITLTLEVIPSDERNTFRVDTQAKTTLAPTNPVSTSFCVIPDKNGEVVVAEMTPQIPGQRTIDGQEQEPAPILKIAK